MLMEYPVEYLINKITYTDSQISFLLDKREDNNTTYNTVAKWDYSAATFPSLSPTHPGSRPWVKTL